MLCCYAREMRDRVVLQETSEVRRRRAPQQLGPSAKAKINHLVQSFTWFEILVLEFHGGITSLKTKIEVGLLSRVAITVASVSRETTNRS